MELCDKIVDLRAEPKKVEQARSPIFEHEPSLNIVPHHAPKGSSLEDLEKKISDLEDILRKI